MNLRKLNKIGNGTYGNVYEAIDDTTSKIYAVKKNFISPNFANSIGTIRELDILKKVKDHPNCVQLINYTFGSPFPVIYGYPPSPIPGNFVVDKLYLILEKGTCDGEKFIHGWKKKTTEPKRRKALFDEKLLFAQNVALGIEFLHSRGLYHRDLKPGNIICYYDLSKSDKLQSAKITDFGLSQYYNSNIMSLPGFVTPWYRAPEITLMKDYDYKCDVWSFGCILFELFSINNKRFTEFNDENDYLQTCINKLNLSEEDFILAKQLYLNLTKRVGEELSFPFLLGYTITTNNSPETAKSPPTVIHISNLQYSPAMPNVSNISASSLNNNISVTSVTSKNTNLILEEFSTMKSFENYENLLSKILIVDPKFRFSITKCLNSDFLSINFQEQIRKTRRSFDIDDNGNWIFRDRPLYFYYVSNNTRKIGMKCFILIYNNRFKSPINSWYSHEIFFHALEMFDRYLLQTNSNEIDQVRIQLYVNTFLFISSKYFRILLDDRGINNFMFGLNESDRSIHTPIMLNFEEYIIRDLFQGEIYRKTVYEHLQYFVSDKSISHLVDLCAKEYIPNGTSFDDIFQFSSNYIQTKQMVGSNVNLLPSVKN